MKRGYPYSSGNLNFGYDYEHISKSSKGGAGTPGVEGPQGPQGPKGDPGLSGTSGSRGQRGTAGAAGARGAKGEKGQDGKSGGEGADGTAGVDGRDGSDGVPGLPGKDGKQGIQGIQGIQGTSGSASQKGDQGPKGDVGPQGPQGPNGPRGPDGRLGADGVEGPPGPTGTGTKGDRGEKGDVGTVGAKGGRGAPGTTGPPGSVGATGIQGVQGPTGPKGLDGGRGLKGDKGDQGNAGGQGPRGQHGIPGTAVAKGDKGDVGIAGPKGAKGDSGTLTERQLVLVDKNFGSVSYEDDQGASRGTFQKYEYELPGEQPFNSGYGTNMKSTRMSKEKTVPLFGSLYPLRIEQGVGEDRTEVQLTKANKDQDVYGVVFAIVLHGDTKNAFSSSSFSFRTLEAAGVSQIWPMRKIGSITANGDTYHYFIARIGSQSSIPGSTGFVRTRHAFDFWFSFTSSKISSGKMVIDIFEGFIFKNLTDTNYNSANVTDSFHYPYIRGSEKQKFKGVTFGNVLLAGLEHGDKSITLSETVKITEKNLKLGAVFPTWNSSCVFAPMNGTMQKQYPDPPNHAQVCLPISILNEESVIFLTNHTFKKELPTTDNKIVYYLSFASKGFGTVTSEKLYVFTPTTATKRSGSYDYIINAKVRVGDVCSRRQISRAGYFYFSAERESGSSDIGSHGSMMYYIILNPLSI